MLGYRRFVDSFVVITLGTEDPDKMRACTKTYALRSCACCSRDVRRISERSWHLVCVCFLWWLCFALFFSRFSRYSLISSFVVRFVFVLATAKLPFFISAGFRVSARPNVLESLAAHTFVKTGHDHPCMTRCFCNP